MAARSVRRTSNKTRATWVGGTAVLALLLQAVQGQLAGFNLERTVLLWGTAIVLIAVLLLQQLGQRASARQAGSERDLELARALIRWPLPKVGEVSPFELGVRPPLVPEKAGTDYHARTSDEALDAALEADAAIVLFGPPQSGKSHSAYEAVRRLEPPPDLLVPRDEAALKAIWDREDEFAARPEPLVLWLDSLERFVATLDVDALARFLSPPAPAPSRLRQALARALPHFDVKPPGSRRLVATIDESALEALLAAPTADGYTTRRLLACATGTALGATIANPPSGAAVPPAGAVPAAWRSGWQPSVVSRGSVAGAGWKAPVDLWVWSLAAWLIVLGGALAYSVRHSGGWTKPAPIADQVAKLASEGMLSCQQVTSFPKDGKGVTAASQGNDRYLVTIVSNADCQRSDIVRFYRFDHDRLRRVSELAVRAGSESRAFNCVGPQPDPCRVRLSDGRTNALVGAFSDDKRRQIAVVFSFAGANGDDGKELHMWPLPVPATATPVAVPIHTEPRLDDNSSNAACGDGEGCAIGTPVTAIAVSPRSSIGPSVLLVGYPKPGVAARRALTVKAWALKELDGRPTVGPPCRVFSRGLPQPVVAHPEGPGGPNAAILGAWMADRPDAAVVCGGSGAAGVGQA